MIKEKRRLSLHADNQHEIQREKLPAAQAKKSLEIFLKTAAKCLTISSRCGIIYLQAERAVSNIVRKVVAAHACARSQYPPPKTQHPSAAGRPLTTKA